MVTGQWSVGWDDILCLNKLGHWRSIVVVVVRKEDMIDSPNVFTFGYKSVSNAVTFKDRIFKD